jgi:hypothetical protein
MAIQPQREFHALINNTDLVEKNKIEISGIRTEHGIVNKQYGK